MKAVFSSKKEKIMKKILKGLRFKPLWTTHLGCIKGCIEYLKIDVSYAWLFGATGHAFILNIREDVCPSGPTAWNTDMLFKLGENLGYVVNGVFSIKTNRDFKEKQRLAFEITKKAIDEGLPCYGWELDVPEFYIVYGYDNKGYYFTGPDCDSGKTYKNWEELGDSEIGVLEMYNVRIGKASDDKKTIKDAFEFVLEHSKSPEKWIFPKYKSGISGYDSWIKALENGNVHRWGMGYNTVLWNECRKYAVEFLKEAEKRVNLKDKFLFSEAIENYEKVSDSLKKLHKTFSFPPKDELKDKAKVEIGIKLLKDAKKYEEKGLENLEKIIKII